MGTELSDNPMVIFNASIVVGKELSMGNNKFSSPKTMAVLLRLFPFSVKLFKI
jgi:hypothetical protein